MTCKDCLHYDVCWCIKEISFGNPMVKKESLCSSFKAKSDFVEFPLKIGSMTILRENGKIVVAGGRTLNSINLNDQIKVKLTTYGQEVYRNQWKELNRRAGKFVVFPHYARVDKEGYTSFQLWDFIETFGEYIGIAKPNVIKPLDIYSVDDEKEQVGKK